MTDGPLSPTRNAALQETAEIDLQAGPFRLRAHAAISPQGLLAVGGLVGSVLLSTAVLVWASTSIARRRPLAHVLKRG